MKLIKKLFDREMSKITTVFNKLNGKAAGGNNAIGWTPADLRRRRLMAFVRGIQVAGTGISSGVTDMLNEFSINVDTFDYDNLSFDLHRVASNGLVPVELEHEMTEVGNHVNVFYQVNKPGQYILDIKYLGLPVPCSPFKINVEQWTPINPKTVLAYGKGLKKCLTGDISTFYLDTKKIGHGRLSINADGKENIPLSIRESKSGYKIKYAARTSGMFFVRVKVDGKNIPGSPYMVIAEDKQEIPETEKNLFKRGVLAGSKEKKNDLQPQVYLDN